MTCSLLLFGHFAGFIPLAPGGFAAMPDVVILLVRPEGEEAQRLGLAQVIDVVRHAAGDVGQGALAHIATLAVAPQGAGAGHTQIDFGLLMGRAVFLPSGIDLGGADAGLDGNVVDVDARLAGHLAIQQQAAFKIACAVVEHLIGVPNQMFTHNNLRRDVLALFYILFAKFARESYIYFSPKKFAV